MAGDKPSGLAKNGSGEVAGNFWWQGSVVPARLLQAKGLNFVVLRHHPMIAIITIQSMAYVVRTSTYLNS